MTTQNTKAATPGPWSFYTQPQPNGCPIVGNASGLMVAMLSHSIHINDQRETAIANARLIAQAPALLEALRELYATEAVLDDGDARLEAARERARAAIAAATGEA